jgi:Flp pilus assembly pilin Flp
MLRATLGTFGGSDHGQDLAEYCLLTALIALIALGIFYQISGGIQGLWSSTGTALVAANASTGSAGTTGASGATASLPAGR